MFKFNPFTNKLDLVTTEYDPLSLHLDQTTPQTMTGGAFAGSGLLKITSGLLGVDTNSYALASALSSYLKLDQTTPQTTVGRFTFPSLTVDTDTLYVDPTNHRVGIGTPTPNAALDIGGYGTPFDPAGGSAGQAKLLIAASVNAISGVQMYNADTGISADFRFQVAATDKKAYFAFNAAGNNNNQAMFGVNRKNIFAIFSNTLSGGTARDIAIGTIDAKNLYLGTTNLTRVTILADGKVGIGKTPITTLDVNGNMLVGNVSNNNRIYFGTSVTDTSTTPPSIKGDQGIGEFTFFAGTTILARFGLSTAEIRGTITFASPLTIAGASESRIKMQTGFWYWNLLNNHGDADKFQIVDVTGAHTPFTITKFTGGVGGRIGLFDVTSPTAMLHLSSGSATAGTAPLKFSSGTLLLSAEAGTIEYLTDTFYIRGTDKLNVATSINTPLVLSQQIKTDTTTPTDLTITTGAAKTLVLGTPVYNDVYTQITAAKIPAANFPDWATFTANTGAYTFKINDYADLGTMEVLHGYKEGTDLEVHLHLATNGVNDATARKVKYMVYYTWGNPDNGVNQFTAESSLTAELDIPANQADKSVYYLSLGTITGTNMKVGAQVKVRVKRIAGTGSEPINDPFLGMVGMHYQIDTVGSRSISAK